jgi:hypothetical protein
MLLFGLGEVIVVFLMLAMLALHLVALVDVLRNEFTGNNKIVWVLVVLLMTLAGPILYFVLGRRQIVAQT